jgi:hypothetical protein
VKSAQLFALAAVFAAESALFCVVTSHRYAWIYPRWYDQVQYLQQAYDGYEEAQKGGFAQGVRQTLTQGSAQGSLHGFFALMAFEAVGPSRMAALSLNLTAFLALQAATFLAVRRLSGSLPIAWASIALLASLHFPWSGGPGSAIDFRLDWMAACAYGVALAAAIAGRGFCSTRWAVLCGAMVGTVIMLRFLTGGLEAGAFFCRQSLPWVYAVPPSGTVASPFSHTIGLGISRARSAHFAIRTLDFSGRQSGYSPYS